MFALRLCTNAQVQDRKKSRLAVRAARRGGKKRGEEEEEAVFTFESSERAQNMYTERAQYNNGRRRRKRAEISCHIFRATDGVKGLYNVQ
jgi:hypothetical protein